MPQRQAFRSIQVIDAFVIVFPPFPSKQNVNAPAAIADAGNGYLTDPGAQGPVFTTVIAVVIHRMAEQQHPAGPPHRHFVLADQVLAHHPFLTRL